MEVKLAKKNNGLFGTAISVPFDLVSFSVSRVGIRPSNANPKRGSGIPHDLFWTLLELTLSRDFL